MAPLVTCISQGGKENGSGPCFRLSANHRKHGVASLCKGDGFVFLECASSHFPGAGKGKERKERRTRERGERNGLLAGRSRKEVFKGEERERVSNEGCKEEEEEEMKKKEG